VITDGSTLSCERDSPSRCCLGEAAGIARRRIGIAGPDGRTHSAWLAEDAHGVPRAYLIVSSDDRGDLHIHEVASAPPGPGGRTRHAATVLIGTMLAAAMAKATEARVSLVSLAEHRLAPGGRRARSALARSSGVL